MSAYRTPYKTAQELARRANDDELFEAFHFWCDVRGKSPDLFNFGDFVKDVWPDIKRERRRLASLP